MTRGSCIQLPAAALQGRIHWISSLSTKQGGSLICLSSSVQKPTSLKSGKGDGNPVSIHSACKSLEGLRDLFGCAPHQKGCRSQLTQVLCCPCPKVPLPKCFTQAGSILAWGNSLAPGPQLQCTNALFSPGPD